MLLSSMPAVCGGGVVTASVLCSDELGCWALLYVRLDVPLDVTLATDGEAVP